MKRFWYESCPNVLKSMMFCMTLFKTKISVYHRISKTEKIQWFRDYLSWSIQQFKLSFNYFFKNRLKIIIFKCWFIYCEKFTIIGLWSRKSQNYYSGLAQGTGNAGSRRSPSNPRPPSWWYLMFLRYSKTEACRNTLAVVTD